jgi:hypothetical protein
MVPRQRICSTASINGKKYNKEDDDIFAHSSAVVNLICRSATLEYSLMMVRFMMRGE